MKNILPKMIYVYSALIFTGVIGLEAAVGESPEKTKLTAPRTANPTYFTHPPLKGKNYNSWKGAKGQDVGTVKVDLATLPSRVDNSSRVEFPPIYKQKWGSCGQFAAIASIFTYEMNVLNGTAANTDATRFPAHFSWNMVNNAKNRGSEAYHGWEVAKQVGIPTAQSYGGVRLNKIGEWPNGYKIWREAMEYRVSGYRYTPVNSIEQVNEARGWLFNRNNPNGKAKGGLMALDGRMGDRKKVTVKISKGMHEAGKKLWMRWGPTGYGHGITCVGYDDKVGHDLNGDGKITNDLDINNDGKVTLKDWERGAFIVVNSWGEKWANDGRIYLLYSAMVDPKWKRGNYLGRIEVSRYSPKTTLKLKLSCDDRSKLRFTVGIARDENATSPDYEVSPQVLNGWKMFGKNKVGSVPIAGVNKPEPLELGIDISKLLEKIDVDNEQAKGRLFIKLSGMKNSKLHGKLHACALRSYNKKGTLIEETTLKVVGGDFGESNYELMSTINFTKNE